MTGISLSVPTAVIGTNTNNSATAGYVGEYISATLSAGSAISLTTVVPADVTSVSLTPGDWDVTGSVWFAVGTGTLPTRLSGWTSATSATAPSPPNNGGETVLNIAFAASSAQGFPCGTQRFSLAATTTIYLSVVTTFTVSTLGAYGFIGARRIR